MRLLVAALLFAGCDDSGPMQMMMSMDLSVVDLVAGDAGFIGPCPKPTRADDPLEIDQTVVDLTGEPLAGVSVSLYQLDGTLLAHATYGDGGSSTGGDGGFSISVATGGKPFYGYASFSSAGQPTINVYSWYSKSQTNSNATIVSADELAFGYNSLGVTPEAGKGAIVAQVADCTGAGLTGATATVQPAGAIIGYDDGSTPAPKPGVTATSSSGAAYALNATAGASTISFVVGAQSIVSPPLQVPADGMALVLGLQP